VKPQVSDRDLYDHQGGGFAAAAGCGRLASLAVLAGTNERQNRATLAERCSPGLLT
jgi:hypothetical protein